MSTRHPPRNVAARPATQRTRSRKQVSASAEAAAAAAPAKSAGVPNRSSAKALPKASAATPQGKAVDPAAPAFTHRNLPLLLLQAREGVMARFRPILNAHGVTEQQWRIVRGLLERGPMEPRQIGQVCRISSPSLAGVLARMDDMGLVQRARMAQDQRRVLVQLTARSRELAAAMAPEIEAAYATIEAHIGTDFISDFYRTLDELITLLGSLPSPDDD